MKENTKNVVYGTSLTLAVVAWPFAVIAAGVFFGILASMTVLMAPVALMLYGSVKS